MSKLFVSLWGCIVYSNWQLSLLDYIAMCPATRSATLQSTEDHHSGGGWKTDSDKTTTTLRNVRPSSRDWFQEQIWMRLDNGYFAKFLLHFRLNAVLSKGWPINKNSHFHNWKLLLTGNGLSSEAFLFTAWCSLKGSSVSYVTYY